MRVCVITQIMSTKYTTHKSLLKERTFLKHTCYTHTQNHALA